MSACITLATILNSENSGSAAASALAAAFTGARSGDAASIAARSSDVPMPLASYVVQWIASLVAYDSAALASNRSSVLSTRGDGSFL